MKRLWIILRNIGLYVTMQWHVLVKLDVQTSIIEFSKMEMTGPLTIIQRSLQLARHTLATISQKRSPIENQKKLILPSEKRISPKQVKTFLVKV